MDAGSTRELKPGLKVILDRYLRSFEREEKAAHAQSLMHALLAGADPPNVENAVAAVDALQELIAQSDSDDRAASGETRDAGPLELSVVIPCLNERETIGICVRKAI